MEDRRDYRRFDVEINVTISSLDFVSNVTTEGFVTDCSQSGARVVTPIYFKPGQSILMKIDMIGGPMELEAVVLECREDARQRVRFEKTNVLHVEFKNLSDQNWKDLLIIGMS